MCATGVYVGHAGARSFQSEKKSAVWSFATSQSSTVGFHRRFARVPLALRGRYALEDGSEFGCQITDVSPVRVALRGFWREIGEQVVAYLNDLGRIEGRIVRRTSFLFALDLSPSPHKLERLASKINWLIQRKNEGPSSQGG